MKLDKLINYISGQKTDKFSSIYLLKELFRQEGMNVFQASEKAENEINLFVDELNMINNECYKQNEPFLIKQIDKSIAIVNRDYFEILNVKKQLNDLSWQEFEDFCGALMRRCFNAKNILITQRSSDGGVDFLASLPLKAKNSMTSFIDIELYGQAKRYSENVQRGDIDKFTAFAGKLRRDKNPHIYSPQIFIFCTTSSFVKTAFDEIIKNKFVGLNGLQMASMVFDEMIRGSISNLSEFINK